MNRRTRNLLGSALLALFVGASSQVAAEFQGFTTATPLFEERAVGNASIVVKTVTGTIEDNVQKIRLQDDLYHNELIETHEESATEITFLDESTLSLGPESSIVLDEFVYDPDPSNSSFVITITEGALRFTSGVLPSEAYKIHTPVATIGIRGTIIDLVVDRETRSDGTVQTSVNLTVVEGEADLINCEGDLIRMPTGSSGRVMGSSADCFEASEPGSQPAEVSAILKVID